jgi:hypothetical protein
MGMFIHHLPRCVKLLTNIVTCMLSVAEATIRDLQLPVLLGRRNCTTTEMVILALQLCELPRCGGVVLLTSSHAKMLLNDCRVSVVLQVEQTLGILSHRSDACVVMSTLGVGYSLNMLLLHRISLVAKQKECKWCRSGVSKAAASQGEVCCLIDGVV